MTSIITSLLPLLIANTAHRDRVLTILAKIFFIFLTTIFLLLLSSVLNSSQVFAQVPHSEGTIVFQDDFSGGFEKWQLIAGNWNLWQIVGEGNQAQALVETSSTITQLIPKDEYWPTETLLNYEYRFNYQPVLGYDRNIGFGYMNSSNWCEIHFVSTFYQMMCWNNGLVILNTQQNFSLANGPNYQMVIRFENGRIRIWIDDFLLRDIVDAGFNGHPGRPLLRAGTGSIRPTQVRFDNVQVIKLDPQISSTPTPTPILTPTPTPIPTPLPVPKFSQLDPNWLEDEYDTAILWSTQPTIGRWGCAMTSMAMILQYYGLTIFPQNLEFLDDGTVQHLSEEATTTNIPEPITPPTLNAWLNSQPDGYLGDGLINWLAVTRLTREISEEAAVSNTILPKLEYSRIPAPYTDTNTDTDTNFHNSLLPASEEIFEDRPVILQIPGHFLVGNGVEVADGSSDPIDLHILDPFYDYDFFSEHRTEDTPLPLLSTRIFTPSLTDLSYIFIVHDPALVISLLDENGEPIVDQLHQVQTFSEQIIDQTPLAEGETTESTPPKLITQLAKPTTGTYNLQISALENGFHNFEVYTYDDQANPTIFIQKEWFKGGESLLVREYLLNYDKNSSSSFIKVTTWETVSQDLMSLYESGEITKWYVWDDLERIVGFVQDFLTHEPPPELESANMSQARYVDLLNFLLGVNQEKISLKAKTYLEAELQNLEEVFGENL